MSKTVKMLLVVCIIVWSFAVYQCVQIHTTYTKETVYYKIEK